MIVSVADNRCTLRGSVSYGVWEADAFEELLHFLIEGCTSDDNLIEVATERFNHLVANLLVYLLVYNRHVEEKAHTIVLNLWEYLLADDLLDNQRYGYDDGWLDLCEGCCDDGRTWHTCEIEDVATEDKLKHKLERHAVHVCHRQDADDVVALLDYLAKHSHGEVVIAPKCAVRHHHAL